MSKKTFQDFLNESEDTFNFHSIDAKLQVSYRSENNDVEIKGTLDSRSLLGTTATAWELFNELEENSMVVTITIRSSDDPSK